MDSSIILSVCPYIVARTAEKIKGYVIINDGEVSITSQADGIQAETIINLSNVKIKIETTGDISDSTVCSKGLKSSKEITINSGDININSTDKVFFFTTSNKKKN